MVCFKNIEVPAASVGASGLQRSREVVYMESNYEKQVYRAREIFLAYRQDTMIRKFQLEHDEEYLYMKLLDQEYRISRKNGEVERQENGQTAVCLDYQVVMTLYDVLCCSGEHPELSGEWCPLASLQVTQSSPRASRFTARYAAEFSGKVRELEEACGKLGGERQSVPASADVCYKIQIFPFFPVIFQFWDGDEEFAPKIMILWDQKSLDFMHFETLYYVMLHFLDRLHFSISIVDNKFH